MYEHKKKERRNSDSEITSKQQSNTEQRSQTKGGTDEEEIQAEAAGAGWPFTATHFSFPASFGPLSLMGLGSVSEASSSDVTLSSVSASIPALLSVPELDADSLEDP
jgi:hypothetical protein